MLLAIAIAIGQYLLLWIRKQQTLPRHSNAKAATPSARLLGGSRTATTPPKRAGSYAPFAFWTRFGYCSLKMSPGESRRKKGRPMEQRKQHPMTELVLFTARELAKQYGEGETRERFDALISTAEESETSADTKSPEHEQGKLPATPADTPKE